MAIIQIEEPKTITLSITFNIDEAMYLQSLVQNKILQGEESVNLTRFREDLFEALKKALEVTYP